MAVRYEVTLEVPEAERDAVERYMRGKHVAEVLATGCFTGARLDRWEGGFRTTYEAASDADLARYLEQHAARLRDDFATHLPAGLGVSRRVFHPLQEWPRDSS